MCDYVRVISTPIIIIININYDDFYTTMTNVHLRFLYNKLRRHDVTIAPQTSQCGKPNGEGGSLMLA